MHKILGRFSEQIYAIYASSSATRSSATAPRSSSAPSERATVELASRTGVAGFIEFFGGLLILVGLFASWAAFISSGEMAVAYFMAHASQGPPICRSSTTASWPWSTASSSSTSQPTAPGKWSIASVLGKDSLG